MLRAYYMKKQHYHRLEDGRILKLSDEFADKLAEFEDVMDIDAREAVDRPVSLPGYRFLFVMRCLRLCRALIISQARKFATWQSA